jgi:cytosine/adenosine deaminase-related metal-dependent hydrolase
MLATPWIVIPGADHQTLIHAGAAGNRDRDGGMAGYELVVRARRAVTREGVRPVSVAVRDGRIAALAGYGENLEAATVAELSGEEILLPGLVDTHVHVNEPGRPAGRVSRPRPGQPLRAGSPRCSSACPRCGPRRASRPRPRRRRAVDGVRAGGARGPARQGGAGPGYDADLVAFDDEAAFTVDPARLRHRHPATPYAGRTLTGVVRRTWLRGQVTGDSPAGRLLTR